VEINKSNFISKKNNDIKKTDKTKLKKNNRVSATEKSSNTCISDPDNHYNDITSRVQRSITREQVILAGIETIRSFLKSGMTKDESIMFLNEIVDKTQFDSEKVLGKYRKSLQTALEKGDPAVLADIIKKVQDSIESLTNELEMNEMKKQNLRSLRSFSKEDNPEKLMNKVIKSLQEEGLPEIKIPRERIADLLGD